MAKVITTVFVRDKLDKLIRVLYENDYFGFIEDVENSVHNIVDFIYTIPALRHRKLKTPNMGFFIVIIKSIIKQLGS